MDEAKLDGVVKETTGKMQNAFGGLTGNDSDQIKGKTSEMLGKAQAAYGDAKSKVGDYTDQATEYAKKEPAKALAIAAGGGLLLGLLLGRRGS